MRGRAGSRDAGQRGDRRIPGIPRAASAADRYIIDVGPSYVVVSAIVVALLYGSWLARAAAALDLALLVVVGNIFGGLSDLDVAAVGHVTAMTVAAALGSVLVCSRAGGSACRSARTLPSPPLVSRYSRTRLGGLAPFNPAALTPGR